MKNKFIFLSFGLLIFTSIFFLCGCSLNKNVNNNSVNQVADLSIQKIKDRGKLIVGTFGNIGSITFHDETGSLVGLDIDIAKEIASRLGVAIEFKEMSFLGMFKEVKSGEVDMIISFLSITPQRSTEMLFSIPYLDGGQVFVVNNKNQNENIKLPQDLKDKKVGVLRETVCEDSLLLLKNVSFLETVKYDDADKIMIL